MALEIIMRVSLFIAAIAYLVWFWSTVYSWVL